MTTPPFLLPAALLFWGWQAGFPVIAAIMAIAVASSRLTSLRIDFTDQQLCRISDMCGLLLIIAVLYYIVTNPTRAITGVTACLPMVLFPLFVVHHYSVSSTIDLKVLVLSLRRKYAKKSPHAVRLAYPYFAVCMIAGGAANNRTPWFFSYMTLLFAWALWPLKPSHASRSAWLALTGLCIILGFAGHRGLNNTQKRLMDWSTDWFYNYLYKDRNPYKTRTAIGDIGDLKPSSRILFRVSFTANAKPPLLLQDAVYNTYVSSFWSAIPHKFTPLRPEKDLKTWPLAPADKGSARIQVASALNEGNGLVKLPNGAFRIENLPALKLEENHLGTVKVSGGPDLATYDICFSDLHDTVTPSQQKDLAIPPMESKTINKIAARLALAEIPANEVPQRLIEYFQSEFRYSLMLTRRSQQDTALTDFMTRTHAGHCEYFATATVLLLRAAGIPARYVTGFSVHERDKFGARYIVRERHAHAWVLAYIDGAWGNVDTTPGTWIAIENQKASIWEPVRDLCSHLWFACAIWLHQTSKHQIIAYAAFPIFILLLIVLRKRLVKAKSTRLKLMFQKAKISPETSLPQTEFEMLEKKIGEMGLPRNSWETPAHWFGRIKPLMPANWPADLLFSTLKLYYRHRFDPQGLSTREAGQLKANIKTLSESK